MGEIDIIIYNDVDIILSSIAQNRKYVLAAIEFLNIFETGNSGFHCKHLEYKRKSFGKC